MPPRTGAGSPWSGSAPGASRGLPCGGPAFGEGQREGSGPGPSECCAVSHSARRELTMAEASSTVPLSWPAGAPRISRGGGARPCSASSQAAPPPWPSWPGCPSTRSASLAPRTAGRSRTSWPTCSPATRRPMRRLRLIARGRGGRIHWFESMADADRFNARTVARLRRLGLAALLRRMARVRAELVAALDSLPDRGAAGSVSRLPRRRVAPRARMEPRAGSRERDQGLVANPTEENVMAGAREGPRAIPTSFASLR